VPVEPHPGEPRGSDVLVDAALNPPGTFFTLVYPLGSITNTRLPVRRTEQGPAHIQVRDVSPSGFVALTNNPAPRQVTDSPDEILDCRVST